MIFDVTTLEKRGYIFSSLVTLNLRDTLQYGAEHYNVCFNIVHSNFYISFNTRNLKTNEFWRCRIIYFQDKEILEHNKLCSNGTLDSPNLIIFELGFKSLPERYAKQLPFGKCNTRCLQDNMKVQKFLTWCFKFMKVI